MPPKKNFERLESKIASNKLALSLPNKDFFDMSVNEDTELFNSRKASLMIPLNQSTDQPLEAKVKPRTKSSAETKTKT